MLPYTKKEVLSPLPREARLHDVLPSAGEGLGPNSPGLKAWALVKGSYLRYHKRGSIVNYGLEFRV